ncbi:TPA: diphosphate--fructose-6-phosphate 1-phosphotransferase [Candidatus Gastranaerophilales bacterium HUM_3]|mgnify:FL=1|nr:diphosphate--fructose-6-phosphate 1-phosphotransferase [Acinetobacter sp.]CDE58901.1 diphosphate--fructose-6-phosphate 1-phosphotransferase [Fusobacterium sp. CAG:439]DAA83708.1 MAG TPA: diphosphate--fructose-6-phosphate 1-phosphotransferase [Candidatus Gastranaerophilales bacterium HUM_3]DAA99170.1 MAG TPA: diphosphate--fructose-6-phosphate 1-phosphotransferase [Candidatus Gastranaerophilales bacterium HUM_10]DAB10206.1 MAG TPA: diphosphate--fructose-6-phosphate 1-phosphotransferase [Candid
MTNLSPLQIERLKYQPKLPASLANGINHLISQEGSATQSVANQEEIKALFKNTYGKPTVTFQTSTESVASEVRNVGVILSGGQAPGGHNVIAGLYDALKQANSKNNLYGFLGGPSGIIEGKYVEFNDEFINDYRNTGGFDIIGSGRTKLETEEQFQAAWEVCKKLNISAVVIIGGDDSNTNAALLAEWFVAHNAGIQVIGCPKTIDGDLKNEQIEISFGFDTATKTYGELIGNIERDANSAKKYWHFVKIMGRSASHVALEAALQTQPNITLISEEVEQKKMSLSSIINYMTDIIVRRSENGKNFGIAVIPEGLIEFVPELKTMIANLNDIMPSLEKDSKYSNGTDAEKISIIENSLSSENSSVFKSLPSLIKSQLLMDRDPHGNVQVSKIETEKLLISMIEEKLAGLKKEGKYSGKFSTQSHFFGYEGRCAFPSNFDADYCYSLGFNAFALINFGLTGYLSSVRNLTEPANDWIAGGVPLTMMMNMERRHGEMKPVIKKALVELDGPVFKKLEENREDWAMNDRYLFPGAIQYFGPSSVCDITTVTLQLESEAKLARI